MPWIVSADGDIVYLFQVFYANFCGLFWDFQHPVHWIFLDVAELLRMALLNGYRGEF